MEAIVTKAFELFTVGGASVGLISAALLSLLCVLVVYSWLVRADPFGALRGLVNHRRQRLETIRTRPWLSKEVTDLADLELRQISLLQLTGIFDYRLQGPAVKLITHFRLRARYLRPWRKWLSPGKDELEGQILLNEKACRRAWRFCIVLNLIFMAMMGLITWIASSYFGYQYTGLFLMMNYVWWFPLFLMSVVPPPVTTRKLVAQLQEFNQQVSDKPGVMLKSISAGTAGI